MTTRKKSDLAEAYEKRVFFIQKSEYLSLQDYADIGKFGSVSDLIRRSVRKIMKEGLTATSLDSEEYK